MQMVTKNMFIECCVLCAVSYASEEESQGVRERETQRERVQIEENADISKSREPSAMSSLLVAKTSSKTVGPLYIKKYINILCNRINLIID